jgi:hypothetical protein
VYSAIKLKEAVNIVYGKTSLFILTFIQKTQTTNEQWDQAVELLKVKPGGS